MAKSKRHIKEGSSLRGDTVCVVQDEIANEMRRMSSNCTFGTYVRLEQQDTPQNVSRLPEAAPYWRKLLEICSARSGLLAFPIMTMQIDNRKALLCAACTFNFLK